MEQTSQHATSSSGDTAGLVAPEAPFVLLPRPTELPPAPAAKTTTTTSASAASSSRPASPSALPGPALLAPGRVRTNSGTTCSAQGPADYDDDCLLDEEVDDVDVDVDDDGSGKRNAALTPGKASAVPGENPAADSPTCIADTSLIDDALDWEVEVSLVEVEVEPSTSDDNDNDNEDESSLASTHDGSYYRRHHPAVQDAPATPRAAQLILEDMSTTPVLVYNSGGGANAGGAAALAATPAGSGGSHNLASFLFCGVTDAMINCHKEQDLTSSPMIRPVSLAASGSNNDGNGAGAGGAASSAGTPPPVKLPDLQKSEVREADKGTASTGADEGKRQTSSESRQGASSKQQEEAIQPSSPIASKLSCAPCKASKTSARDDQKLHEQTAIEATIGNFLSSPGEWCDGWQAWSLHMAAVCDESSGSGGARNANNLTARDQAELKTVLRNRAGDLNARRKRIHRLRRDLSPFDTVHNGDDGAPVGAGAGPAGSGTGPAGRHFCSASTAGNSPAGSATGGPSNAAVLSGRDGMATPPPVPGRIVKKSRSFTDAAIVLTRSAINNAADDGSSVVSITSSIVDAISNCDVDSVSGSGVGKGRKGSKRSNGSGKAPHHRRPSDPMRMSNITSGSDADGAADEDLCYDSDPEHANGNCRDLRRQSLHQPKPRLPPTAGGTSEKTNEFVGRFLSQGGTWSADEPKKDVQPSPAADIDPMNDNHIAKAVDGILHRRMMLVWHQPEGPVAVYAWIELGSQLRSALIQPKLMWKPVHETEDERGALGITNHINLHSVDLLDISRILAATKVDRKKHPLAKSKCSLSIETFDHNLLFEASCQEERDALVQGLKGLVARLASKIIVGDERVFDEYFTPFGASVPGEAPEWATSRS